ncbi:MAG TPA: 16S rRNA (cytosine(1402)-N(4))-methyltransferase RsmH [Acidobacteriaceae bacterium]|jgi:16S rRNA (cytosine1402-N4)-methyltransferase|nr:16S rRNA (cytosine(1402)-N(4))-methyltransferase RsmH [Acidobacteriaceae bacterium]
MQQQRHVPVLLKEAIRYLGISQGSTIVDATLGFGGHSTAIVQMLGPKGHLIAFDRDPAAMEQARARLEQLREELAEAMPQVTLHAAAFGSIAEHVPPASVDGILADFGVSSMQLDTAERGFSFQADGPLDMRMDTRSGPTAEQVVNQAGEEELANLIYEFGEERRSRRIARAIVRARPLSTTAQLAKVVAAAAQTMKYEKIHPATRTFQALRIYVNKELEQIQALLDVAPDLLKPGGRLVAISFHSLEDRLVKDALRSGQQEGVWQVLTKKPVQADDAEIEQNPRSRSAKLRAAERVAAETQAQKIGGGNRKGSKRY